MAVSLKIVMSAFIGLTVVITAIIAFVPLYLSGRDSVRGAVTSVRSGIINQSSANVDAFFRRSSNAVLDVSRSFRYDQLTVAADVVTKPERVMDWLAYTVTESQGAFNNAQVQFLSGYGINCDTRFLPAVTFIQSNRTNVIIQMRTATANRTLVPMRTLAVIRKFGPPIPVKDMVYVANMVWSPRPFISYNTLGVKLGAPLVPFGQSAAVGFFGVSIVPEQLNTFLANIGLREGGRAAVFFSSSRFILANSWREDNVVIYSTDDTLPEEQRGAFKTFDNITDPLMLKVASTYGVDLIFSTPTPFAATMGKSEKDETFVDIISVRDEFGLDLRIVIAMPMIDFIDKYYSSRTTVIIILVVAVVVLIAVSVAFAVVLARPLDKLGARMALTASLQDDGTDDAPSGMSEIAEMQRAYVAMKAELNRMKVYLPASVLQAANSTGDDDGEDDEGALSASRASENGANENTASMRRAASGALSDSGSHKGGSGTPGHVDDTASRSSRSSRIAPVGVVVAYARGAPRALNLASTVIRKRVTVLVINVSDFLAKTAALEGLEASRMVSRVTTIISKAIRDHRGVLDFFQGGFVVATFNAVNNVASHNKRAATAAFQIAEELGAVGFRATMGASSSAAIVGNMGDDSAKRFVVVGSCYREAVLLERLCKSVPGARLLVTQSMLDEIGLEFHVQFCEVAPLKGTGKPTLIASVESPKTAATGEWMYFVNSTGADPFSATNVAIRAVLEGHMDDARAALSGAGALTVEAVAAVGDGDGDVETHSITAAAPSGAAGRRAAEELVGCGSVEAYVEKRFPAGSYLRGMF